MDGKLKINEDFAKKYNKYREKEELQKLKSKYGDINVDEDTSDSESEDESAEGVTPALERGFFRTLACLRKKDPSIYDKSKVFYAEENEKSDSEDETDRQKKQKPMYLKDYERKVVLENEGKFVDDLSDVEEEKKERKKTKLPSYREEQNQLKEEIKKAIIETEGDSAPGDLLVKRTKSLLEEENEEKEFRQWLKTPEAQLNIPDTEKFEKNKSTAKEVSPLKEYWCDPNLEDGEKFLRDYILDRKYLDKPDDDTTTYEEVIGDALAEVDDSEDELFQKKSEVFEHKFNFRFEEPDQDFIKTYPRTIGSSVRRRDDSRKKKREEKKKRDEERKKKKQEELKQLKLLKKKEIMDKIVKLQEATGNKDIAFTENDLNAEFDPDKHDERMQEVFGDYDEDFDEEKPVFSDLEDMEEYENYLEDEGTYSGAYGADCEDPDFIMDCDYNPVEHEKQKEERKKRKGKQSKPNLGETSVKYKKSAFYESVAKEKPVFDPNQKSFENFLDEYYALDYEDLIGDLPCRFKYRPVVANNFGLTTEEILGATDKELNAWCSLKRTVQYRDEYDEIQDVKKYRRKGKNVWKKARVLKSVYETPTEQKDTDALEGKSNNDRPTEQKDTDRVEGKSSKDRNDKRPTQKINSRKRKWLEEYHEKMKLLQEDVPSSSNTQPDSSPYHSSADLTVCDKMQSRRKKLNSERKKVNSEYTKVAKISQDRLKAYGLKPKKYLKKLKYGSSARSTL